MTVVLDCRFVLHGQMTGIITKFKNNVNLKLFPPRITKSTIQHKKKFLLIRQNTEKETAGDKRKHRSLTFVVSTNSTLEPHWSDIFKILN